MCSRNLTGCFKAYDIRGRLPDELDPELFRRIGYAYAQSLKPRRVAVGHDIRLSSRELADAVVDGLLKGGVDVLDIGLCGTENIYFATAHEKLDGGIMITASHNPADYNGMKLVRQGARPVSADTGLNNIRDRVADESMRLPEARTGTRRKLDVWDAYTDHLLSYVDIGELRPLRIVANPGNGGAGLVVQRLQERLPFDFIPMDFEPDGTFPNGVPNPLLPENQGRTSDSVLQEGADLGIAWDGDFDRCFLFDEKGSFVNGYYMVSLIAEELLARYPGEKIVHDPRLTWNTIDVVNKAGGIPVQSKTGHAFIKHVMREQDAIYGGEISGHHYFREFAYCDSGMIPWLLVTAIMSRTGKPLSELVADYQSQFPASDEINRHVQDAPAVIAAYEKKYRALAERVDETDGLGFEFTDWRFNVRMSNTEPLLRFNIESQVSQVHLQEKIAEVLGLVDK